LLPVFESSARTLSFTLAGAELSLTQSAVSRQIQALEENLGVRLFERRTRALALTDAGAELLRLAQDVLGRVDATTRRLRGDARARTVTLTTMPSFAALWLIPRLSGFTRAHPDVDVRISANVDLVNLERANVDVAVRYCPPQMAPGAQSLFGDSVIPMCSPQLLRDRSRPLARPADLKHHVLLHLDEAGANWLDWNLWLRAVGVEGLRPAGALRFNQYDQVIHAAMNGQGIALGRQPLLGRLLREKKLVAPFPEKIVSSRSYFVMASREGEARSEVQAFIRWLVAEAAADADAQARGVARPASKQLAREKHQKRQQQRARKRQ
jgi:DNA-binding transcriptional LysR family regulator